MLNFRNLKQDFSSSVLKEGKALFDREGVVSAKVIGLSDARIRISSRVKGQFDNIYESEIEIDRHESQILDSNCDCTYTYDCQHLGALIYYLEEHLGQMILAFSQENQGESIQSQELVEEIRQQETQKHDEKLQQEELQEYLFASQLLSHCPFFLPEEKLLEDRAELAIIYFPLTQVDRPLFEIQLALRLPYRSKPLNILRIKEFIQAIRYHEAVELAGRRYFFTSASFDHISAQLLELLSDHLTYPPQQDEKQMRSALIEQDGFGMVLAKAFELLPEEGSDSKVLPCIYSGSLDQQVHTSTQPLQLQFNLRCFEMPQPKLVLQPYAILDDHEAPFEEGLLLICTHPGFIYRETYYTFVPSVKRAHLSHLAAISKMTIPESLFGTFIENVLPELQRYATVIGDKSLESYITQPYAKQLRAKVALNYFNDELEASLTFCYDHFDIPAAPQLWNYQHTQLFITQQGIIARALVEEKKLLDAILGDFSFEPKTALFVAKTEKKVIEFMTDIVPAWKHRVDFDCPETLLSQFLYDKTHFTLHFAPGEHVHSYKLDLKVEGALEGVRSEILWDCVAAKKSYIDFAGARHVTKEKRGKILIFELAIIAKLLPIFDELGIKVLESTVLERPLWTLAGITHELFEGLPVTFSIDKKIEAIQRQMTGAEAIIPKKIPKIVHASLRSYQEEGVNWLDRLRRMYLSGILADDMGLGKTLQAIVAIAQMKEENPSGVNLIICPTSLLYNWRAECRKFCPTLKVLVVDGNPTQRKKIIDQAFSHDLLITTYSLLQKDVDLYEETTFDYVILDEAQHIKNRTTRNAKSVKQLHAKHRIILTGTPVENSLDDLWSLFDFLMPGLLGGYDRFVDKYLKAPSAAQTNYLRRKLTPFILRRMKKDVLQDLPKISHIVYYCELSSTQRALYASYAQEARKELVKLVDKEGFDRVQIHVLATLTRLKQICCHPAIFAKEKAEDGDSAKYEMLLELIGNLREGRHKAVIFSQYTKMLQLLHDDLQRRGIPFAYLDGTSKHRLEIVEQFNKDDNIPLFLVSLKAGGAGLNITGADTVIHYDMWWNPAVESQATDRVWRMGQERPVSSYKLITVGTIEEKIMQMQERKKGLADQIVRGDEEILEKLTWEEVLELLQI